MMKTNLKLIMEVIIIIALLLAIGTVVYADPVIIPSGNANTQNDANTQNAVPNVISNTANTTNTANTVANTTNTTNSTSYRTNNTTNTLPKTGVTDGYVVAILVTVCAISAIYAYRKIRDYNA